MGDLDGGAGAGAVVAPGVDGFEGSDFALHGFGAEAEDFCGAVEGEGEIGDVGSDDGDVGMRARGRPRGFGFRREGVVVRGKLFVWRGGRLGRGRVEASA